MNTCQARIYLLMAASHVFENIQVKSHKGTYKVKFYRTIQELAILLENENYFFIVDKKVVQTYSTFLNPVLNDNNSIVLQATESNKSIENVIPIIETLVERNFRRNQILIAIGGGIIQDIVCFIASTIYRGVDWKYVPTTLLSQADSCIGSKSSINLGRIKNIIGTFNPPSEVLISPEFLTSLHINDLKSGIGEILKVCAIDSVETFNNLINDYDSLIVNKSVLGEYIKKSLLIKQKFIEVDEFDKGIRNIFNYGHSFGHEIETVTDFKVPHGIAVSIGMDMANQIAAWRNLISQEDYQRMHQVLIKNYSQYLPIVILQDTFFTVLAKDKKNTSKTFALILPNGSDCQIKKVQVAPDESLKEQCNEFLKGLM